MIRILGSFHYLRRVDLSAELAAAGGEVDFFADSGAFSAMTVGARITVADYAAWLLEHRAVINMAATLDVVFDPAATRRNHEQLLDRVGGLVQIVPAYHVRSPWAELRRYCAESSVVALGGVVRLSGRGYEQAMMRWCAHCHVIARDSDTRLHGFGLTRPPYPEMLPWYSVDSSSWCSAVRTGVLGLFDPVSKGYVKVSVGHPEARRHAQVIAAYDGDAREVCAPGFGLVSRVGDRGRADARWIRSAALRSEMRREDYIRGRHPVVAAPRCGRIRGDGFKTYLAVMDRPDIRLVLDVARREGRLPASAGAGT